MRITPTLHDGGINPTGEAWVYIWVIAVVAVVLGRGGGWRALRVVSLRVGVALGVGAVEWGGGSRDVCLCCGRDALEVGVTIFVVSERCSGSDVDDAVCGR